MNSSSKRRKSPSESSFGHAGAHEAFDIDALLRALAHPRRREILCLLDAEPEWTTVEMAANLGSVVTISSAGPGEEAAVALRHWHLPVLADANLVAFDETTGRVERGADFRRVRELIDAAVAVLP